MKTSDRPPSPPLSEQQRQERARAEEKKRLKRAANRRSACTSRVRKKQFVEEMTAANAQLQLYSEILARAPPTVTVDQNVLVDAILQRMQEMGFAGSRPQQSPSTEPPNPPAAATAAAPPASNTEPEAESWRESGWIEWNESQWNPGQTDRSQQMGPGLASGSQSGDRWTTWQDNSATDWNQGR